MNLVRFDPWSISDLMKRDFDRLNTRRLPLRDVATPAVDWVPAVDIVELKDGFLLRADVPGVVAEDIEVSMEDSVLTISGQRPADAHEEDEGVRRFERKTRSCRKYSHGASPSRPRSPVETNCPVATLCCSRASLFK
jgi:HSP20 family protein